MPILYFLAKGTVCVFYLGCDIIQNMNNLVLKNRTKAIDYEKNLRNLLGWEDSRAVAFKKYFGFLKGTIKKSGVNYQREIRKEWERKSAK